MADAARRKPNEQGSARKPLLRQRGATFANCGQSPRPRRGIAVSSGGRAYYCTESGSKIQLLRVIEPLPCLTYYKSMQGNARCMLVFKIENEFKNATVARTVRFTEALFDRLNHLAQENSISFNLLVLQCCKYALDHVATPTHTESGMECAAGDYVYRDKPDQTERSEQNASRHRL